MPFSFKTIDGGGGVSSNGGGPFIFAGLRIAFLIVASDVTYAFFDDGGGPDWDYDDMTVRILPTYWDIGETPAPAFLPFFTTSLGLLGYFGYRRRPVRSSVSTFGRT